MKVEIRDDFDLDKIASCGQCFRARRFGDGGYRFISGDAILYIRKTGKDSYAVSCGKKDWKEFWSGYFDLERDYAGIRRKARGKNAFTDKAMRCGRGIRILHQQPWETLATFLLSQRKNIPAISRAVEALSDAYGHAVATDYETLHAFPAPEELARASETDLRACGLGYRAPYVLDAVRRVSEGELDLKGLSSFNDEELLSRLRTVRGAGEKVSNCVALFAYGRTACVPRDVWINRAIEEDFGGTSPFSLYGENAGIIQQYIFYYERSLKKS